MSNAIPFRQFDALARRGSWRKRERDREKPARGNLSDCARNGYWWCFICNAVCEVNVDREQNVCTRCGSPRIKHNPPAL
jgi:rubrerythrin